MARDMYKNQYWTSLFETQGILEGKDETESQKHLGLLGQRCPVSKCQLQKIDGLKNNTV